MRISVKQSKKPLRYRVVTFFLHFVALCCLFSLPEMFTAIRDHQINEPFNPRLYLKPLMMVVIFYVNYLLLFRLIYGKKYWVLRYCFWNVILIGVIMAGEAYAREHVGPDHFGHGAHMERMAPPHGPEPEFDGAPPHARPPRDGKGPHRHRPGDKHIMLTVHDLLLYILTSGLSLAVCLVVRQKEFEKRNADALACLREEELDKLKAQLQPHFLFNTLNSIYALIDIDADTAKEAVHRLSSMLRYVLYENPSGVTLEQELNFVANYINLKKIRLDPAIPVNVTLNAGNLGHCHIAPLIFINLIENAFKHGISGNKSEGIDIEIIGLPDGTVKCRTENFINRNSSIAGTKDSGVGLSNLRRRLELLYGPDATLNITRNGNKFIAELIIKLNSSPQT